MANIKKLEGTYRLIVSRELESKIRYMCSLSPDNEWSGALFYTVEGSFDGDVPFVATAVDFCLCDVGTSTYTEFETKPEVVAYMCNNDLLDCYIGLIHSHDKMKTFFSGTDTDTLKQEGELMPHFLSLIVNNAGEYTAAITRKVERVFTGVLEDIFYSFNGSEVKTTPEDKVIKEKCILYNMMDIYIEGGEYYPAIKATFEDILREKKKNEAKAIGKWGDYYGKPGSTSYSNSFRDIDTDKYWDSSYSYKQYKQGELFPTKEEKKEEKKDNGKFFIPEKEVVSTLKMILNNGKKTTKSFDSLLTPLDKMMKTQKDEEDVTDALDETIDSVLGSSFEAEEFDDDMYFEYLGSMASSCINYIAVNLDTKKHPSLHIVLDLLSYYSI